MVFTVLTLLVTVALLTLLLNKTKIGLAFRAVSSNLESSQLVGIRVGPTLQFGWALAAELLTVTEDDRVVLTTRGRLLSNELFHRLL